ncbi:MAG: KpsF/GutQ family sugar-phosphate isomerase [Rhodospirillales bacterium]|nr:MAG: KpsF/GutQ family sugar-phosphate isomerase [Rhodospirillales bacterium]
MNASPRVAPSGPPSAGPRGDLDSARRVLATEASALRALADGLGEPFARALDLLGGARGRVIVSGMGKNSHIGGKIAATFASTGTPAHFVHPAEASHGDLGMVVADDVVLAISNSGETPELSDLILHVKRFAIPLVAIVGRNDSTLARAADAVLTLPDVPEACPMGLAPTTSTTATLALGDALAVALLERKGFTASHFRVFHPGGRLGQRLVKVGDIMHRAPALPVVGEATPMAEALIEMTAKSFGCVAVVDSAGRLTGIVTDGDLRRHMDPGLLARAAREIMTPRPRTIAADALAAEAVRAMNATGKGITSLFVLEEGRPVGILHLHDCLRAGVA